MLLIYDIRNNIFSSVQLRSESVCLTALQQLMVTGARGDLTPLVGGGEGEVFFSVFTLRNWLRTTLLFVVVQHKVSG